MKFDRKSDVQIEEVMSCEAFLQCWNDAIDSRETISAELMEQLSLHASQCQACAALGRGFLLIQQGCGPNFSTTPPASEELTCRILESLGRTEPRLDLTRWHRVGRWAAAAAVLASLGYGVTRWRTNPGRPAEVLALSQPRRPSPLSLAMAQATEATLGLARDASAPAARLGREVIETAPNPDTSWPIVFPNGLTEDTLQAVGTSVNDRLKPLAGSTRQAFSFLMNVPIRSKDQSLPDHDVGRPG